MPVPLREYYPIKRAAELLNCDVMDILHWAEIGAIRLYLPFDSGSGYVSFNAKENELIKGLHTMRRLHEFGMDMDIGRGCGIATDGFSYIHENEFSYDDLDSGDLLYKAPAGYTETRLVEFYGFWSLPKRYFGYGCVLNIEPSDLDYWVSCSGKMIVRFELEEALTFNLDGLYIMKGDFKSIAEKCCTTAGKKDIHLIGVDIPIKYYDAWEDKLLFEEANSPVAEPVNKQSNAVTKRHASNRLAVVHAAIRFKENHKSEFDKHCVGKDGAYKYPEWARQILDRTALFPNGEQKVKSVDTVAKYISEIFKDPNEKK